MKSAPRLQSRPAAALAATLATLAALTAFHAAAQTAMDGGPLGLVAAQQLAVTRSMALPAQDAVAAAARERAVAAGQRPDPVLRIGLDNVPIEGDGSHRLTREPTTARSIGLTQAWPDARAARIKISAVVSPTKPAASCPRNHRSTPMAVASWNVSLIVLALLAAISARITNGTLPPAR